jgi:hypothetical protein
MLTYINSDTIRGVINESAIVSQVADDSETNADDSETNTASDVWTAIFLDTSVHYSNATFSVAVTTISAHSGATVIRGFVDHSALYFQSLKESWHNERRHISSSAADDLHCPSYVRIIGMGRDAVPFILEELRSELKGGEPENWFMALAAITGEKPVAPENRGRLQNMATSWIEWGTRGMYNAQAVGTMFSANWFVGMP